MKINMEIIWTKKEHKGENGQNCFKIIKSKQIFNQCKKRNLAQEK